ncbi:MAG: DUF5714 domain-containing protein [Bacilli bacterium]|nr:DUF5714 domain-containing protein [Bacilli bacterium]
MEQKYSLIKTNLIKQTSTNPIEIVKTIMHMDFINIHGPEHHLLDGGALLVAMFNAGYEMDLEANLDRLAERSIKMPGAMCGNWGVCGSVTSLGAVFSVLDGTGPLSSDEHYAEHMEFTSRVIKRMSEIGGPRCCKRNAFITLTEAIKYVEDHYGIKLAHECIECEFSSYNKQCIKDKCPFHC